VDLFLVIAHRFTRLPGLEGCTLTRQQNGCFQLWLGNAMLLLTGPDLPRLVELVRLAIPQLNRVFSDQSPEWHCHSIELPLAAIDPHKRVG